MGMQQTPQPSPLPPSPPHAHLLPSPPPPSSVPSLLQLPPSPPQQSPPGPSASLSPSPSLSPSSSTSPTPPPTPPPSLRPSPSPPPPSPPVAVQPVCRSYAASVCAGPNEPCFYDDGCSSGAASLGCNAGGVHWNCRFCGFGVYSSISCPVFQMTVEAVVAGTVDTFDHASYASNLARELNVSVNEITLNVTAASVRVVATIRLADADASRAGQVEQAAISLIQSPDVSTKLNVVVESISEPTTTTARLAAPSTPSDMPPPPSPPPLPSSQPATTLESASSALSVQGLDAEDESSQDAVPKLVIVLSACAALLLCCCCCCAWCVRMARKEERRSYHENELQSRAQPESPGEPIRRSGWMHQFYEQYLFADPMSHRDKRHSVSKSTFDLINPYMAMMYNITARKTRRSTARDTRAGQEASTLALETSALAALETMPAVQETGSDKRAEGAASTDDGKGEHEDAANGVGSSDAAPSHFKVFKSLTRKSRFTAASQLPAPSCSSKGVPLQANAIHV